MEAGQEYDPRAFWGTGVLGAIYIHQGKEFYRLVGHQENTVHRSKADGNSREQNCPLDYFLGSTFSWDKRSIQNFEIAFNPNRAVESEEEILFRSDPLDFCAGVYLVRRTGGLTKIGASHRLRERLRHLRKEHGHDLRLLHFIHAHDERRTEGELHRFFRHKRIAQEWFDLNETDLRWLMGFKYWPQVKG
jgi:hypothetical protein